MKTTCETVNGITVLTPQEENLDASNAKAYKKAVAETIVPSARVVLDLSRVQFVDSGGLGAILSHLKQLKVAGGEMKVCSINKPVRILFELVGFHQLFDIFNTRDEAVRSYQT